MSQITMKSSMESPFANAELQSFCSPHQAQVPLYFESKHAEQAIAAVSRRKHMRDRTNDMDKENEYESGAGEMHPVKKRAKSAEYVSHLNQLTLTDEHGQPRQATKVNRPSHFKPSREFSLDEHAARSQAVDRRSKPQAEPQERLFTASEVQALLKRREEELTEDYNRQLQILLQQQFENFDRFVQDYVSRRFKRTDFSYLN